jgi:pyruvate formate lyase activating enzyme
VEEGGRGFCGVRAVEGGGLISLNYGYAGALNLDPVEKKPLYHFRPGTATLSLGAPGCSFDCLGCQNHGLSRPGESFRGVSRGAEPASVVAMALRSGAGSLSFTYSEPTVFYEYAFDVGDLGAREGLPSVWVTNGYFSKECLDTLSHVAAMNIDLKGFSEEFYQEVTGGRLAPVLESIRRVHARGVWLEVTTLLIPGLNDDGPGLEGLAGFIASLSPDIPWHISRFSPMRDQSRLPATSEESLLRAREIGRSAGLRHVYLGNIRGKGYGDTLCPSCGEALVERDGFSVLRNLLKGTGACPKCGCGVAGRW